MSPRSSFPLLLVCFATLAGRLGAENWPQWRGPRADGTSIEPTLPLEWGTEKNLLWKTAIPGEGHSSPIIWDDRVFVTTAVGEGSDRQLLTLDAVSGELLWSRTVVQSKEIESVHQQNNFASSTPATNGSLVFTSFLADGRMHIHAVDFAGNVVWKSSPLAYLGEHGYNHTPMLHKDLVLLDVCQLKEPAILALDQKTGKVRWKIETDDHSCSNIPPLVVESGGTARLFTCGNNMTREIEPMTGKVVWSLEGPTDYCVAGLLLGDGILLASGGYPERRSIGIRLDHKGGEAQATLAWEHRKASTYVPSSVFFQGHFFMINDGGIITCIQAASGMMAWQERIPGNFRSSLILNNGRIYATNDEGTTTIFEASAAGLEVVGENKLDDFVYTTPSPSNGRLHIRTGGHLLCIGTR